VQGDPEDVLLDVLADLDVDRDVARHQVLTLFRS